MKIFRHLPNFITCLNLLSGSIGIILALHSQQYLIYASLFIAIASVFDFLDGFMARLLKAYSPLGKELDSLADMVSFGVLPSLILFQLMKYAILGNNAVLDFESLNFVQAIQLLLCLAVAVFSGLRLAKFNIDTRQTESFLGMATPACALFIASLPVALHFDAGSFVANLAQNSIFLTIIAVILPALLVSEIPMFSLKIKTLKLGANIVRYTFLLFSICSFVLFNASGLFFIIPLYVFFSVLQIFQKSFQKKV